MMYLGALQLKVEISIPTEPFAFARWLMFMSVKLFLDDRPYGNISDTN